MVQLRHDSAGSAFPPFLICGLQVPEIITFFNISPGSRPLADDPAGIMGIQAINRTVIDTVLNPPPFKCRIILVPNDAAGKPVCYPG